MIRLKERSGLGDQTEGACLVWVIRMKERSGLGDQTEGAVWSG